YGFPVHLYQDYLQSPPSRNCEVIGDSGKILVDLRENSIRVYDRNGNISEDITFQNFNRNQLFLDEMKHFIGCIKGEQKSSISVHDGAQSLRIALAIKKSM